MYSGEVITLSSDDEFESPPPKKLKFLSVNRLKEITAVPCEDKEIKVIYKEETNLITIEDKSKENETVVNLIDDSFEDNEPQIKEKTAVDCLKVESTTEECLVIGSESETEVEGDPLVVPPPTQNCASAPPNPENYEVIVRPSTSKASEAHNLLEEFLDVCTKSMRDSKYADRVFPKYQKMRKSFNKCEEIHNDPNFHRTLQDFTESAKGSAPEAVVSFQRLYSYILDHIKGDSVEVPEENLPKIRKLEKTLKKLMKVIRRLEEAEVDFNDEEDSTYMKLDRYTDRLNKVYKKYCELLHRNPFAGRLLYEKIKFVHSKYNEINRAITKSYKHNRFPTYYDIEKCVRKCVKEHNLELSENEIREESKSCFTKMGNLLQMKRKKELYEVHCGFITLNEDPANKDQELKTKLQESRTQGDRKLQEIVEKYVKLQDGNVNIELSEDSDDSDYKSSDSGE
ncbi:death domain-associated protein 6-like isoform X2 [Tribolium madens]|uniref:death domain-associated protein 6-like isoform X2 n=1 Tax=Tribolium madens TaxID=41895 RepID=UPI001CF73DD0|nr:death domain-associated protein 6-like isoform X2 [Tribolium madens]